MLGWHISVYRTDVAPTSVPDVHAPNGERVAVWDAGLDGLDWVWALVQQGKARLLGGDGYPGVFAAPARHLLPTIGVDPPDVRVRWTYGTDVDPEGRWVPRCKVDDAVVARCDPDEWLLVQVWDAS